MKLLSIYIIFLFISSASQAMLMTDTSLEELAESLSKGSRIGVFIGSFDPLHKSHEKLIETALDENLIDFLIVGANDNMTHKPNASSWDARNSFLTAVYSNHPRVLVANDLSFGFPITGNTVSQLRELIPELKIFTIIGNDIATMPHLKKDVPKMTFENGGQIDGWLVNNSRPQLNNSQSIPDHIAEIPVRVFNSHSKSSSSDVRRSHNLLKNSKYINKRVFKEIEKHRLYGINTFSCKALF